MGRTRAEILRVETYPLNMTDAELQRVLGGLADSELMRALVMAEVDRVRSGANVEQRTMRGLWYDYVKPVLSRMGRLAAKTRNGKDIAWDGLLSDYLLELVRDGLTTYAELRIVDGSRQRRAASSLAEAQADVALVGGHYPWLVLFCEKDTVWPVVEDVATLYGVSAISGGGEPSAACTENTVKQIFASDHYHDSDLFLLSVTDYDPHGYYIANSQHVQLQDATGGRCRVHHERLGMLPSQLTQAERRVKAYAPKEAGLDKWYQLTGGVDGAPLGLELDALGMRRLRALFAEHIERFVNLEARRQDLREALVDLLAWEIMQPEVDARLAELRRVVKSNGLWRRIADTPIPADLFRQAAVAGWDRINPRDILYQGAPLFDCLDDVRAAMVEAL
ncbi:MAG: hypothetical protein GX465_15810 [Acidobacteria bacterium]|nr:hypothetical protein [Acidobacteriota bacterium]